MRPYANCVTLVLLLCAYYSTHLTAHPVLLKTESKTKTK